MQGTASPLLGRGRGAVVRPDPAAPRPRAAAQLLPGTGRIRPCSLPAPGRASHCLQAPLTQLNGDDAAVQGGAEVANHLVEGDGRGVLGSLDVRGRGAVVPEAADLIGVRHQLQQLLGFAVLGTQRD